jgi:hypothetical protein
VANAVSKHCHSSRTATVGNETFPRERLGAASRLAVSMWLVNRHPLRRKGLAARAPLVQVDLRLSADREHLQRAARRQVVGVVRRIAVEAGAETGAWILGLIDNAGALALGEPGVASRRVRSADGLLAGEPVPSLQWAMGSDPFVGGANPPT